MSAALIIRNILMAWMIFLPIGLGLLFWIGERRVQKILRERKRIQENLTLASERASNKTTPADMP